MSDKKTEAMKLALEALEYDGLLKKRQAIAALREALTQEKPEPAFWVDETSVKWLADRHDKVGAQIVTRLSTERSADRSFALYISPVPAPAAHGITEPSHA